MIEQNRMSLYYLAWIFFPAVIAGLFAMSVGQSVVDFLYQPLAQFGFDSWLRSLGNLQAAYDYLSERDNLARWNRIVLYYAFIIPLLPLSWLTGVKGSLYLLSHPVKPMSRDRFKLQGVLLILCSCLFFLLSIFVMTSTFLPDLFTVGLNAEHLPIIADRHEGFFKWFLKHNSVYASDKGFFHAPINFVLQSFFVLTLFMGGKLFCMQVLPTKFGDILSPISGYFKKLGAGLIIMSTVFVFFTLVLKILGTELYGPCVYTSQTTLYIAPGRAALIVAALVLIDLISNKVLTLRSVCLAALCPAIEFVLYIYMFLKTPGCTL